MSKDPFPERAETSKLFARNGSINAVLPLRQLTRLSAGIVDSDAAAAVEVALQFGHDEEGRRRLRGQLQTRVVQLCQRCLQPMDQDLHSELDLLVLDSEAELDALPDAEAQALDVLIDEDDALDLLALIEDELLLSLPLAPLHEDADCSALLNELRQKSDQVDRQVSQQANPFAVLASLKAGKTDTEGKD